MLVAVTGGTGFLGAHTVAALVGAGHAVRLLVRPTSSVDAVLALGVDPARLEVVTGDVTDDASVAALLDGCDAAVHAAAPVFTYEAAWLMTTRCPTDDRRTHDELGVRWRPIEETIRASVPGRG